MSLGDLYLEGLTHGGLIFGILRYFTKRCDICEERSDRGTQ